MFYSNEFKMVTGGLMGLAFAASASAVVTQINVDPSMVPDEMPPRIANDAPAGIRARVLGRFRHRKSQLARSLRR